MKHYLLQTANGLHTPPCNNSHGKSLHFFNFRFSLFTPLLVLFLLIVGNSSAWARPTIYGEGLPGLNASGATNWDSNTKEMSAYGEADTYYTEFLNVAASSDNKYRFKIAVNGSGNWWDGAMNSGNTNESMGNVDIVNGKDGDNQISFKMPFDGDVYIFYKSTNANNSKVWIVAVPSNIAAPPTGQSNPGYDSGRALKTDLIFKSDRTGWGSGIRFTRSFTTTYKHVTSYILPTKKNTEDGKIRFEMYYGDSRYIDGKSIPAQLSTSTPRRIIYMWDGGNAGEWVVYTLPTYPIRKSGWKLFVNEYNSGNAINLDANGEATLTLTGGNTYHFFIANTDYATNISNYSSDICSSPAVHSVNCFGGCYIDENNSSNVTFSEQQVYKSSSCGTLVKSVVAAQDMRGVFKVDGSGAKDVTFNFDGGVITINAVDHGATPELSGDYYVFGAGGTNWVTGWKRSVEANKMTITDGVATKTFYNVSGQGLEFKIHKGETEYNNSLLLKEISENNSHLIKRVWKNGTNIDFSISDINVTHKADVTVHFDGEHIWLTAVPSPETIAGSEWYIMGSGNVGTEHTLEWDKSKQKSRGNEHKMTIQDGVATITYTGVSGNISFKVFRGSDEYEINDFYYNASASSGIICTDQDGNDNINVNLNNQNISIHWDGTKIWTTEPSTPSGVTFDGSEYFFWNTNVSSWGTVLAGKDRTQFLQFKNTTTNATAHTKLAFLWKQTNTGGNVEGILAAKAPSGEWNQVRHCRVNADDWNEGAILGTGDGSTDWIDLQEGNYMYKESGSIKFTTRTAEHFKFFLSGTVALAGGSNEFNPWNGNGTLYTDRITKTLEAGTYKFKINPDMTIYDSRGGVNKWTNEFNWDDLDAANSSDNIKLRDGNNKEIWFDLDKRSEVTIACDGSKVTVVAVPAQQYTITFNTDGGSTIAPIQVSDGSPVARPADPTKAGYTFVKWQSNGSDYDFSSAVNSNITLNAVWAYKSIESVSLNESEHMTWVGNSDFTLTRTYSPSDVITKAVTWSSNNTSVATVNDGIVHAVGAGTATITCTITDMLGNQRSATCEVTVAACEMTTDNIYSMTVTSYNTSIGHDANLVGLWNENTENGVMTKTARLVRIAFKDLATEYMTEDANGKIAGRASITDNSDKWMYYSAGTDFFYLQNYKTGHYLYKDKSTNLMGQNGDWKFYGTKAAAYSDADTYRWIENGTGDQLRICNKDNYNGNLNGSHTLMRYYVDQVDGWNTPYVRCGLGGHQGNNPIRAIITQVEPSVPNPFFVASQMNTSYYRMKENATVQANLTAPLVSGAVITVRLYADAATSVKLTKDDGTEVATINLIADTEFEYSYTVNNDSPLLGEDAFIIKAEDNHAGIASIKVTHTYVANPATPELSWETDLNGGVTQSALGSTFQHVASSTLSSGAIHYASSDEAVATVAADGTVTPHSAGTTTITATIAAEGCYDEASISYNITLTEASLQEAIDATPVGGTLTLTHDYSENAVINKAITLDAKGHTIGDLIVKDEGDLTLRSELTVRDFTIYAKAGNTSTPAASGQVRNASKLKVNGNAYFLYTVDPSGHVQYGWYDFTVPFPINIVSGIKGIQGGELKEDFRNGVDYAVMEYFGDKQAQGQYPYKKFSGVMQPNRLYTITLDDRYNYNTLRMQKTADGALVAGDEVKLNAYPEGDATNANWNGVGNGTLHHADAGISGDYIQVYQSGDRTFLTVDKNDYSLVVGSAFMVQQAGGTMMLNQATHGALLAPSRYQSTPATTIQIASEGKPFSDQLFITASETGGQTYTPGVDVAKAGELGSASVPQIWTNAYNSSLCVHEAQLINGKAQYKLSIYAPVAGTYTLTSKNIPADYSLYLTQNGMIVSELSDTYTLDLSNGITTEYGLLLAEIYNSPTGIDNTQTDKIQTTKIIRNGVLYILHNGKVYNAQGAMVK